MSKKRPVSRDLPEPAPSSTYTGLDRQEGESVGDYRDRMNARVPVFNGTSWTHEIRPGESVEDYQMRVSAFHAPEGMQIVDVAPVELPSPTFESDLYAHIREWWMMTANEDANLIVRKYEGYGDHSLTGLGRELAELTGREATRGQMQQLAIYYFLLGKMARLKNALLKGEQASDDTWQDITCYAMMGRKIQQHDGWPYDTSKGQALPFNGGLRIPD